MGPLWQVFTGLPGHGLEDASLCVDIGSDSHCQTFASGGGDVTRYWSYTVVNDTGDDEFFTIGGDVNVTALGVPEPSEATLLVLGIAVLGAAAFRLKRG
jgi:hypothetical protein